MNPDSTDMNSITGGDNSTGASALKVLRSVRVSNRGAEVDGELVSGADVTDSTVSLSATIRSSSRWTPSANSVLWLRNFCW